MSKKKKDREEVSKLEIGMLKEDTREGGGTPKESKEHAALIISRQYMYIEGLNLRLYEFYFYIKDVLGIYSSSNLSTLYSCKI